MTSGKHRKRKNKKSKANSARQPIVNTTSQEPDPKGVPNPGENIPQPAKQKRPPSTVGEIVMAVFVGATVVIYIILTCVSVASMRIDQRAWVSAEVGDKSGHFFIGIHNSGKTPALKVGYVAAFTPGNLGTVPKIDFSNDPDYPVFTGNLPADVVERLKKEGVIPDHPQTGLVVAPGKTEIASFFDSPINQTIGFLPTKAKDCISWEDSGMKIFGRKHETRFCYWVASPTDFPMCLDRNYMD